VLWGKRERRYAYLKQKLLFLSREDSLMLEAVVFIVVDTGRGNMKIKGAMGKKKKTIRLFKTKVITIVLKS